MPDFFKYDKYLLKVPIEILIILIFCCMDHFIKDIMSVLYADTVFFERPFSIIKELRKATICWSFLKTLFILNLDVL